MRTKIVAPTEQRRALAAVLATLKPSALALPEALLETIPPRPPEYESGREHFKTTVELIKSAQIPEWVSVDGPKLAGTVLSEPDREQMPKEFNEQLVVEYYSR